jgi:hypothetical protein
VAGPDRCSSIVVVRDALQLLLPRSIPVASVLGALTMAW